MSKDCKNWGFNIKSGLPLSVATPKPICIVKKNYMTNSCTSNAAAASKVNISKSGLGHIKH